MNPISGVAAPPLPADLRSPTPATAGGGAGGFLGSLKDAIQQVQQMQTSGHAQVEGVLNGSGGDLNNAMIAVEKADLAFQFMMQVRNKIVQAYQEVAQMSF
ncbi:MAG: flagellar hook-basal body complex protein FliE [Terriglobales bacterium]